MNYYQSGYIPPYPAYPTQNVYPQTSVSNYSQRDSTFSTRRVQFNAAGTSGNNLEVFIITNSLEAPIVTLADNDAYPHVRDYYARAETRQGFKGIHLSIRFEASPANGKGFAVNIAQPGMNGNFAVIPLA